MPALGAPRLQARAGASAGFCPQAENFRLSLSSTNFRATKCIPRLVSPPYRYRSPPTRYAAIVFRLQVPLIVRKALPDAQRDLGSWTLCSHPSSLCEYHPVQDFYRQLHDEIELQKIDVRYVSLVDS